MIPPKVICYWHQQADSTELTLKNTLLLNSPIQPEREFKLGSGLLSETDQVVGANDVLGQWASYWATILLSPMTPV